jgi:hypothetical protein
MSSRRTSSVLKEDVVFPRMLYCDSRCSQTLTGLSLALPGALLSTSTRRLGDGQRVLLRQRVRGSVRAVRAVRNTRVFRMESGVVADVKRLGEWIVYEVLLGRYAVPNEYAGSGSGIQLHWFLFRKVDESQTGEHTERLQNWLPPMPGIVRGFTDYQSLRSAVLDIHYH